MKVAAILGRKVSERTIARFAFPDVDLVRVAGFQPIPPGTWDAALLFGGDGTVHLHLRELHECHIPMLVVPVGSGNDFADALGIASVADAEAAWREFYSNRANVLAVDLGEIKPFSPPPGTRSDPRTGNGERETRNAVLFCCIGGAGLDAQTNRRANRMVRWVRGHGGYVLAAIAEIAKWRAVEMRVESRANSSTIGDTEDVLRGPATLVAFANASTYGHGMKMAPRAQMNDGKLDLVFVKEASRARLLTFFPTVFSGKHVDMPEVEYRQAEWLRLETERPMAVYADGEYVCDTPVEVRVLPRALRAIVKQS